VKFWISQNFDATGKANDVTAANKRSVFAWCLYDWGNTAFGTVIITFVFSVYFARVVVGDETHGAALWGYAIAASGFLIAVLSPFVGAVVDHYGPRKPGLMIFSLLCVIPTALLYFAAPGAGTALVMACLCLLVVANMGYEIALVYANAMLPHIAPPAMIGRISGWAWGMGYAGGLACLVVALFGFVGLGDAPPLLPVSEAESQNVRLTAPLVAAWYAIFMLPLLFWAHDVPRTGLSVRASMNAGLTQLRGVVKLARGHKNLALYLCGSALYRDGLNTLFAMGGLYAAGMFGMSFQDILIFAIGLNVTAGIGAALFAFMDDRLGSKAVIAGSLLGLIAAGVLVLMAADKNQFIMLALVLGIFIGPVQAASRTLVARLSPPDLTGQSYGIFNLTGRAVAFIGPLFFAAATQIFETQKAGMVSIILFWVVGLAFLAFVRENKGHEHYTPPVA
jgi:UMF1 family MFS transporter